VVPDAGPHVVVPVVVSGHERPGRPRQLELQSLAVRLLCRAVVLVVSRDMCVVYEQPHVKVQDGRSRVGRADGFWSVLRGAHVFHCNATASVVLQSVLLLLLFTELQRFDVMPVLCLHRRPTQ